MDRQNNFDNIYFLIPVIVIGLTVFISLGKSWWFFPLNIILLSLGTAAIGTSTVDAVRMKYILLIGFPEGIGAFLLIAYLGRWERKIDIILMGWTAIMVMVGLIEGNRRGKKS